MAIKIRKYLCKLGIHLWKEIFFGCPAGYNGYVTGKSCQRCGLLLKEYSDYLPRPKEAEIGGHYIFTDVSMSHMTNEEKKFYLRNLNNSDKD